MQVFINERSLNSQFDDKSSFFTSLKVFLSAIKSISEFKREKRVFKSNDFFYYTGIQGTHLQTLLKSDRSINTLFFTNLQQVNPKSWQEEQIHDPNSSYVFNEGNYCTTSVAEIAERKVQSESFKGFLLNFEKSQFGSEPSIEIIKDERTRIVVDCNTSSDSIRNWLLENGFVEYDVNCGRAPMDYETVLRDNTKFEKTDYPKNNGRTVYRRIDTQELWVVDSSPKHAGPKAHIEVFDEGTREHLGTSLYNQIQVDKAFKKPNRYITLKQ